MRFILKYLRKTLMVWGDRSLNSPPKNIKNNFVKNNPDFKYLSRMYRDIADIGLSKVVLFSTQRR